MVAVLRVLSLERAGLLLIVEMVRSITVLTLYV